MSRFMKIYLTLWQHSLHTLNLPTPQDHSSDCFGSSRSKPMPAQMLAQWDGIPSWLNGVSISDTCPALPTKHFVTRGVLSCHRSEPCVITHTMCQPSLAFLQPAINSYLRQLTSLTARNGKSMWYSYLMRCTSRKTWCLTNTQVSYDWFLCFAQ